MKRCGDCRAACEDLDIVCPGCGALLYEPDVIEAEVVEREAPKVKAIGPTVIDAVEVEYIPPGEPVEREPEPDAEAKGRRLGEELAEAIFGKSFIAKTLGSAIGGYVGREVKAGAKLVSLGADGKRRRFPTAVPRRRKKKTRKSSSES